MWHIWGRREVHTGFGEKNLKERVHLEDLDVNGRIILKCILKELFCCVDWIDPTQNRGKWRAYVKNDTNNLLSIKCVEFLN
jgi:hypothetical protein